MDPETLGKLSRRKLPIGRAEGLLHEGFDTAAMIEGGRDGLCSD